MTSLKQAKQYAKEFVKDLEKELGYELVYIIIGSVAKGKYVPGKSDIDLFIVPGKRNVPKIVKWHKACLLMLDNRKDKKYPKIFKAGRMTSIIDPVIFWNTDTVNKIREIYYERKNEKV